MKLFRFMSREEFIKLVNGEDLENNTVHEGHTESIGFCFMEEDVCNNPEYAYEFLSGVVSEDICVRFETEVKLKEGYGIYADPYGSFWDTIIKTEYSITKYNNKDFKILEFAIPVSIVDNEEWQWTTDIKEMINKLDEIKRLEIQQEQKRNEIKKEKEKIQAKKIKDLNEFLENMQEERSLEIKIKDKYYKCSASIDEIENIGDHSSIIKMSIFL